MGKFIVKHRTLLKDIFDGKVETLPESDLSLQDNGMILQFDYEQDEDEQKQVVIKPGSFNLVKTMQGIQLSPMEFVSRDVLTSVTNTSMILGEAEKFFSNLSIYDELNQPKKRGILLYGSPGQGKTVSIMQAAKDLKTKDSGTVVINWPTSEIEASGVFKFFTSYSEYTKDCTKLVLIIEDIGGSSHEGYSRRDEVSSSLLNLLDGINNVFTLPTLIISTTNHPENLMRSLANRPGRFDMLLEVESPNFEERVKLIEFISKKQLTEEEKEALNEKNNRGVEQFSVAHLQEIVVRSRLHQKPISDIVKELLHHSKLFNLDFAKPKRGMGFSFDDV
jgi:SpoVK/Ycf46/Vps4 family AAA+-type ATPase